MLSAGPAGWQADEKHKREKYVLSVAFSPDGRRLACGVMDGTVAVFDVPSGKLMHTLTGHHKPVRDVCFTPGQRSLKSPHLMWCLGRSVACSLLLIQGMLVGPHVKCRQPYSRPCWEQLRMMK